MTPGHQCCPEAQRSVTRPPSWTDLDSWQTGRSVEEATPLRGRKASVGKACAFPEGTRTVVSLKLGSPRTHRPLCLL